jgi:hypothetical protein
MTRFVHNTLFLVCREVEGVLGGKPSLYAALRHQGVASLRAATCRIGKRLLLLSGRGRGLSLIRQRVQDELYAI